MTAHQPHTTPPVVALETELDTALYLDTSHGFERLRSTNCSQALPGQARILLDSLELFPYLSKQHLVPDLDKLAHSLSWLNLVTPHHAHIFPLHHQAARGRQILVNEEPNLHLVWYYDKIFIKPIPRYMLSRAFWEYMKKKDIDLWKACAGFMRTYWYLVQFEIDFQRALDLGLIPIGGAGNPITYSKFINFVSPFSQLSDGDVNARYGYGELRLTRLNTLAPIFLRKLSYFHVEPQWRTYIGHSFAPLLTIFVFVTTTLNAMQVELTAQGLQENRSRFNFGRLCVWFSCAVIILLLITAAAFLGTVVFIFFHECLFAKDVKKQKRRDVDKAGQIKSCVV